MSRLFASGGQCWSFSISLSEPLGLPYFQFSMHLGELERTPVVQSVRFWKGRKQSKYCHVTAREDC